VSENIGEAEGVLVADDTGFIKEGEKSCGVQRQYTGTLGKVCNCQIGVFLTYAGSMGHTPLDRRLYIPESWIDDSSRCTEAGIPEDTKFQTKSEMALEMIQEATVAGVPYKWVTGDCAYGDYDAMRNWLEENGKSYVLNISAKEHIDGKKTGNILHKLPNDGWFEASCGKGSKGERIYDWQLVETSGVTTAGFKRVILVRRSKSKPYEMKAYITFADDATPDLRLVEVAGTRWTVESCYSEHREISDFSMFTWRAKAKSGLTSTKFALIKVGTQKKNFPEIFLKKNFPEIFLIITFAMLALALLTVLSAKSLDTKTLQQHNPDSSSLDDFKRGRNLRV